MTVKAIEKHMQQPLSPRSIAIVGASENPKRVGGVALDHLIDFGFAGNVYPVNPKYTAIQGLHCYPDIESLPEAPDVVVLSVSADSVLPMLQRSHAKGIRAAVVYSSGFAEEGQAGAKLQQELTDFSRSSGMLVCGPNCMGLANLNTRAITAFATLFKDYPPRHRDGHVGLITQSGNVCIVLYAAGSERGVKFNHFINTGNEACLEFSQYLDFLAEDPDTHAVAGYIEGLRDGENFIRVAARFRAADKPMILMKAGESERGSLAAMSHTASLAGDRMINRAAFLQLGIMQARDPQQLADLAYLVGFKPRHAGRRVAVASISGAMGALLTDLLVGGGLDVPAIEVSSQRAIKEQVPGIGMVSNPVDMTAQIYNRDGVAAAVFKALASSDKIDVVLVYATGYLLERIADELIEASRQSGRLFVAIDTGRASCREALEQAGIPVFTDIARASAALAIYLEWHARRKGANRWFALRLKSCATSDRDTSLLRLDEAQTKTLLGSYGVPVCKEIVARGPEDAAQAAEALGMPAVLKILSPDIAHKTEVGGVRLHLNSVEAVSNAHGEVLAHVAQAVPGADLRGTLVQKMEAGVCELIVGVTRDPLFGLAMTVGLGGVMTEVFRDVSHRLLPVDESIAKDMLHELRGFRLMDGFRGKPRADIAAACKAIAAVSNAAMGLNATLQELEINPLLVKADGEGVVALDALLIPKP